MFAGIGLASLFVALCFAEVGSRFESTGGPIGPARVAFGRFVGFEVGWMLWFSRVSSGASVINGLALALGFYWPVALDGRAARAGHPGRARRAHLGQPARHQADVVAGQRLHHRQDPAAGRSSSLVGVWFADFSRAVPAGPAAARRRSARPRCC